MSDEDVKNAVDKQSEELRLMQETGEDYSDYEGPAGYVAKTPEQRAGMLGAMADLVKRNPTGEQADELSAGVQVQTEDIFSKNQDKLSAAAVTALNNRATVLATDTATARFLGKTVPESKLQEAVQTICDRLNDLADKGFLEGALAPLFTIKLNMLDENGEAKLAVLSYPMVKNEGLTYVDSGLKSETNQ